MTLSIPSQRSFTLFPLLAGALLAGTASSGAVVVASWDAWANDTTYAADTTATDFAATASIATTGRGGSVSTGLGFGSTDGTFGTVAGADTGFGGLFVRGQNGDNIVTIELSNNTGQSFSIDSLHFDFGARVVSPDSFILTYTSGGLGAANTMIDTQTGLTRIIGSSQGAGEGDYADFDYNLGTLLADNILGDGESAEFSLVFSGQTSASGSSILDNLMIQGTAIPEPSSQSLFALLGVFGLLRRNRRA